jgi:hypothetical protein
MFKGGMLQCLEGEEHTDCDWTGYQVVQRRSTMTYNSQFAATRNDPKEATQSDTNDARRVPQLKHTETWAKVDLGIPKNNKCEQNATKTP